MALCGDTPAHAESGHRRPPEEAMTYRYWQLNPRNRLGVLPCDCDKHDPVDAVLSGRAPPPNAALWNLESGHSHALYILADPIGIGGRSSVRALQYAYSVWDALDHALGADLAYTGRLSRGPFAAKHDLEVLREEPYTLRELAQRLPDFNKLRPVSRQEAKNADSRNQAAFDHLRLLAYSFSYLNSAALHAKLTGPAEAYNLALDGHPRGRLSGRELDTVIRSIVRWVALHLADLRPQMPGAVDRSRQHSRDRGPAAPVDIQRTRQQEAGVLTAERRAMETRTQLAGAIAVLRQQGLQVTASALQLATGFSRTAVYNHSDMWARDF